MQAPSAGGSGGAMTWLQRKRFLDSRQNGGRTPRDHRGEGEIHHFDGGIFSSWQKQGGWEAAQDVAVSCSYAALGDKNLCS